MPVWSEIKKDVLRNEQGKFADYALQLFQQNFDKIKKI